MANKNVRTIADIARLAGVSKSTVSRALSDSSLISEETKTRVRAIAQQYNFQINLPARRLSLQQSSTLAFVTHGHCGVLSVDDLFGMEILGAISTAAARNGYDLLMVHVDPYDDQWPGQYLNTGRVDGFILMTSTRKEQHVQALLELQAPFIVWGIPVEQPDYCSVAGDNLEGGRLATAHLLEIGRRRIAFLGGPQDEMEVQLRYQGYARALEAAGLPLAPQRVAYGEYTSASGAVETRHLLETTPDLDALFANSDLMAIAAIKTLQESGRRVPEDVAVVGYDDLSIAQLSNPSLTTIRQNIPYIGELLVKNLVQYLQTGKVSTHVVPVELMVRKSSGGV